jgi:hypothetical protein
MGREWPRVRGYWLGKQREVQDCAARSRVPLAVQQTRAANSENWASTPAKAFDQPGGSPGQANVTGL